MCRFVVFFLIYLFLVWIICAMFGLLVLFTCVCYSNFIIFVLSLFFFLFICYLYIFSFLCFILIILFLLFYSGYIFIY